MDFPDTYKIPQKKFNLEESCILVPELKLEIRNSDFESFNKSLLSENIEYRCLEHNQIFETSKQPKSYKTLTQQKEG